MENIRVPISITEEHLYSRTGLALGSLAVVKVIRALSVHKHKPLTTLTLSAIMPYTIAAVVSDSCIAIALVLLLRTKRSAFESIGLLVYANSLLAMLNARRVQPTYTVDPASGSSGETAVFSTVLDFSGPGLTSTMASGMPPTYPPTQVAVYSELLNQLHPTHDVQMHTDPESEGELAKTSGRLSPHYVPTLSATGR
ncbi:hypothetical protein QCA50_005768 [Cerrena zonata]|uniref:Uncharacterized protein n=1 Tax=Cerrena zonata TaxID=2478898 RepID=A0AAW0GM07_9APHY